MGAAAHHILHRAAPRYGMWVRKVPVRFLANISMADGAANHYR